MKFRLVIGTFIVAMIASAIPAVAGEPAGAPEVNAPRLEWIKLDTALKDAIAQNKHVMVDVYSETCGYCKLLDRNTYSNPDVRKILAESYLSVKVLGTSRAPMSVKAQPVTEGGRKITQLVATEEPVTTEQQLSRSVFLVRGYPTILFLGPDGKVITSMPGYKDPATFKNLLNFIKDDLYEVMTYQDYLESLNAADAEGSEKS